jgi:hypothetical protein
MPEGNPKPDVTIAMPFFSITPLTLEVSMRSLLDQSCIDFELLLCEWFRRWRYDESIRLDEDQELPLRSYHNSRFANLPQIVLSYREERITLGAILKRVCEVRVAKG